MASTKFAFSVIEILIVIVIVGVLIALTIPRFQENTADRSYKKDIEYFIENIGRAQSMAQASNSRSCLVTEKLSYVSVERINTTQYRIMMKCVPVDTGSVRSPILFATFSLTDAVFSSCVSDCTLGDFYANGDVTNIHSPVRLSKGSIFCDVSISSNGVINTTGGTCP